MIHFLADENFDAAIVRGILRRRPGIQIITVQQLGLRGAPDSSILDRAAQEDAILLTHDANTMPRFAYERNNGHFLPGVFIVPSTVSTHQAIGDNFLLADASHEGEWLGQVRLPLPLALISSRCLR